MPSKFLTGTSFRSWTNHTVNAANQSQIDETAKDALKFYKGDHWQMSAGWAGPTPDPVTTSPADATAFMEKVKKAFTSSNVLAEVVDRHVSAVVGREPGWQFVPLDAPEGAGEATETPEPGQEPKQDADPLVAELEAAVVAWCEKRNAHQYIQQAAADCVTASKGLVRLFIPPGLLEAGEGGSLNIPAGLTFAEALDLVYIEKIDPETGGTACDRSTMAEAAFVVWNEKVQQGEGTRDSTRTELQYTELRNKKRITVLRAWDGQQELGALELELGGHLLMHEMSSKPMVTTQLMQLQRSLNFAFTAMGNNNANAGFLERIITNAQTPGTYTKDPNDSTRTVFTPAARYPGGPGSTVMLTGHPTLDENGNVTGYTNPMPHFRDPSSPEAYKASIEEYRQAMYMESKQGHLLAQADGSLSGASRIQLRSDFETSLRDTRNQTEATYRWLLETLAKLGAVFTGSANKYDGLRATVQANVNTGPLTDGERSAVIEQFKEGLRSRESAMVLLGVDDPDAEFVRIVSEMPNNPARLEDLAMLGITLLPEQVANLMQRAGLVVTPEQITELQADRQANQQLRQAAGQARNRALNPQEDDQPTDAPPAGDEPPAE